MIVRRELPADEDPIRRIQLAAFGREVEAGVVDLLRADAAAWIPELSFVAERDGDVVGHVVCSRATLDGAPTALGLGPIGVLPEQQGRGTGLALVHAVVGAADALGEGVVVLLGSEDYYSRFGFVAASTLRIEAPDPAWGAHFQARTLTAYDAARHRGAFAYPPAFDGT